jgi:DNA polymerase III sliding clamp (beta) subunit (PCNA family)
MTNDAQLTIGGETLDEQLRIETTGRVIRPFRRMITPVTKEYKMYVADDGLHVTTIDAPNVMYVDITQPAETLETLEVDGEAVLGLNDTAFGSALSDARYGKSTDDPITLTSDGSTLETVVDRDYSGIEATVTDRLSLTDPDSIRQSPNPIDLDRVGIDLPPQALVEVLSSFDREYMSMTVTDGTVLFGSETDTAARQMELDVGVDADVEETIFSQSYIDLIVKGLRNGYIEETTLHLGDNVPLSVEFTTKQGAVGEYCLAPRVRDV